MEQNGCMPKKVKRTRIKVEEVKETPEEVVKEDPEEMVKEEPPKEVEPEARESVPKVTSFSQLDSSTIMTEEPVVPNPETNTLEPEKTVVSSDDSNKPNPESELDSSKDVKEWLRDIRPDTSKDVEKGGNGFNGKLFFGLLIVFILLGALAGGLFYYKQKVDTGSVATNPEPTAMPTVTPTPEVKVDLTTYSVNVLNGSGTAGEAGVAKDLLVTAGFDTAKVKTANATKYDYESTEVQVKVDVPTSVTDAVIKSLGENYTVEVLKENLKDTSSYDIVVTVGVKK